MKHKRSKVKNKPNQTTLRYLRDIVYFGFSESSDVSMLVFKRLPSDGVECTFFSFF